jgi:hypothetical protein
MLMLMLMLVAMVIVKVLLLLLIMAFQLLLLLFELLLSIQLPILILILILLQAIELETCVFIPSFFSKIGAPAVQANARASSTLLPLHFHGAERESLPRLRSVSPFFSQSHLDFCSPSEAPIPRSQQKIGTIHLHNRIRSPSESTHHAVDLRFLPNSICSSGLEW